MPKENHTKNISIEDVGVLVIGYNRPEFLVNRINELKLSGVKNLYISIDGGPESETEKMQNFKNYALACFEKIEISHHKSNLGLVKHITNEVTRVLSLHKYIVVIEDDIKISPNFCSNIINGLTNLENLNKNGVVSGYSPIFRHRLRNLWRLTHVSYFWGWGCSAETWKLYNYDLRGMSLKSELMKSRAWNKLNSYQQNFWLSRFEMVQKNPFSTWDYQFIFISFLNNFINLSPVFSISGNEGFEDVRSVHNFGKKPKNIKNDRINMRIITKITRLSKIISIFDMDNYWAGAKIKIPLELSKFFKKLPQQYP